MDLPISLLVDWPTSVLGRECSLPLPSVVLAFFPMRLLSSTATPGAFPCGLSLLPTLVAYPCCLPLLPTPVACPRCPPLLPTPAAYPCYPPLLPTPVAYPCCPPLLCTLLPIPHQRQGSADRAGHWACMLILCPLLSLSPTQSMCHSYASNAVQGTL